MSRYCNLYQLRRKKRAEEEAKNAKKALEERKQQADAIEKEDLLKKTRIEFFRELGAHALKAGKIEPQKFDQMTTEELQRIIDDKRDLTILRFRKEIGYAPAQKATIVAMMNMIHKNADQEWEKEKMLEYVNAQQRVKIRKLGGEEPDIIEISEESDVEFLERENNENAKVICKLMGIQEID